MPPIDSPVARRRRRTVRGPDAQRDSYDPPGTGTTGGAGRYTMNATRMRMDARDAGRPSAWRRGHTMTTKSCLTLVVAACLLCGGVAHAQVARSQFNGTVTDSAGGVLVGATVIATNVETNVESKATTTDAGVYVIPYLANGLYRIRVEAAGFRPAAGRAGHASCGADADARLQAQRRCHHRSADGHGAGDRNQHRGDRPLRLEQGIPDVADPGGGRPAAGAAVHLFESARVDRRHVRRGDQRRPQLFARDPRSKAFRSAATCRAAATTRCRRRPRWWASSSCRPARSAPNSAAARRRSPTSSSSPGRTTSTGRARSTCRIRRWTRGRSRPRRSARTFRNGSSRTGRSPSAARSCCRNTTARTAASSMPRSRRPTRKTRPRPRSARCRRASSRTAIFRVCSIRPTPVMPARERSSAPTRSDARCASARSTIRARRASSTAG